MVLLLFASSALRFPGTFLDPTFWAEDCTAFFRNSVEDGPSAILAPLYGSYHLLPRLIAFVTALLPTYWAPVWYAVAAGLLSSLSLSLFSRAGFRWLVPDDRLRVLMCWLFSLAPGTYESYFALCTVNYAMFCGVFLLLLERDGDGRWQMGVRRALLVSFLWFSVGQGLVLAVPIAYLFWLTRNRNYLLCLATLAGATLLNATAENSYRPDSPPGPGLLALLYFENLAIRLGFIALVPYRWLGVVNNMESAPFLLSSLVLIGSYLWAAFRARRPDAEGARVLAVAVLSAMAHLSADRLGEELRGRRVQPGADHPRGPGRPGSGRAGSTSPLAAVGPARSEGRLAGGHDRPSGLDHLLRPSRALLPAAASAPCASVGVASAGRDHRRGTARAASRHSPGSSGDTQDPLPPRSRLEGQVADHRSRRRASSSGPSPPR